MDNKCAQKVNKYQLQQEYVQQEYHYIVKSPIFLIQSNMNEELRICYIVTNKENMNIKKRDITLYTGLFVT